MSPELRNILLDFLEWNIRKMFYGTLLAIIIAILMTVDDIPTEAKTMLIGLGGYCSSQFKNNPTKEEPK